MRESAWSPVWGPGRKLPLELSSSEERFQNNQCQGMEMTDVIEFLERMGQDPQLRHAAQDEVERALISAEIAPELRAAILAKDQEQIVALLGQAPVCVAYFPAKEDEEEGDEGEGEEIPSEETDETPEHNGLRTVILTA